MALDCKVSRIQQIHFCLLRVSLVRLRTGWDEDDVPFAPHRQDRHLAFTNILLELWIERHVGLVVHQQLELDVLVSRAVHEHLIEIVSCGIDNIEVRLAFGVLPLCFLEGEKIVAEEVGGFFVVILPPRFERVPEVAESLFVGVPVLADDGRDGFWPLECQAKGSGCPVIEDVDGKLLDIEDIQERSCCGRQIGECVLEVQRVGDFGEAVSWEVGSYHMVFVGQEMNQFDILVGRGREAVEQEDYRSSLGACFAVEDSDPVRESCIHLSLGVHFDIDNCCSAVDFFFFLLFFLFLLFSFLLLLTPFSKAYDLFVPYLPPQDSEPHCREFVSNSHPRSRRQ